MVGYARTNDELWCVKRNLPCEPSCWNCMEDEHNVSNVTVTVRRLRVNNTNRYVGQPSVDFIAPSFHENRVGTVKFR